MDATKCWQSTFRRIDSNFLGVGMYQLIIPNVVKRLWKGYVEKWHLPQYKYFISNSNFHSKCFSIEVRPNPKSISFKLQ